MIKIVDCNLGNVKAVSNMLYSIGYDSEIITEPNDIKGASFLILPGVGSFDHAMTNLGNRGWVDNLRIYALDERKPLLGICLGMQILTEKSEEGEKKGLGFIKGKTISFDKSNMSKEEKIPHMGWNTISVKKENILFKDIEGEKRFYFVHSYHVELDNPKDILTTTTYGYEFTSALIHENIIGVQFHPEKSHRFGFALLSSIIGRFI